MNLYHAVLQHSRYKRDSPFSNPETQQYLQQIMIKTFNEKCFDLYRYL